jgi:hypothetical protein
MRTLLLVALALMPSVVFANFGSASGTNRLGEYVVISELEVLVYPLKKNGKRADWPLAEYKTQEACKAMGWVTRPGQTLDCRGGSLSPIAGAVYKVKQSRAHRNNCGPNPRVWVCVSGCAPKRVPTLLIEDDYEC